MTTTANPDDGRGIDDVEPEASPHRADAFFPTTAPVAPDQLIGRHREVATLVTALKRGEHRVLMGPSKTGKTSIAWSVAHQLEAEGWMTLTADLSRLAGEEDLAATLAPNGAEDASADRDLLAALKTLDRYASQKSVQVLIVIDSFQEIVTTQLFGKPDEFTPILRQGIDSTSSLRLLFVGGVAHVLRDLFTEKGRPLQRLAQLMSVAKLDEEVWAEGLAQRFADGGCAIHEKNVTHVLEVGEGHPRATMLVAQHLYRLHGPQLASADPDLIESALEAVLFAEAGAFHSQLARVRTSSKHALPTAMRLARGESPYKSLPPAVARQTLRSLETTGVVEHPRSGAWQIVDPIFREYLLRLAGSDPRSVIGDPGTPAWPIHAVIVPTGEVVTEADDVVVDEPDEPVELVVAPDADPELDRSRQPARFVKAKSRGGATGASQSQADRPVDGVGGQEVGQNDTEAAPAVARGADDNDTALEPALTAETRPEVTHAAGPELTEETELALTDETGAGRTEEMGRELTDETEPEIAKPDEPEAELVVLETTDAEPAGANSSDRPVLAMAAEPEITPTPLPESEQERLERPERPEPAESESERATPEQKQPKSEPEPPEAAEPEQEQPKSERKELERPAPPEAPGPSPSIGPGRVSIRRLRGQERHRVGDRLSELLTSFSHAEAGQPAPDEDRSRDVYYVCRRQAQFIARVAKQQPDWYWQAETQGQPVGGLVAYRPRALVGPRTTTGLDPLLQAFLAFVPLTLAVLGVAVLVMKQAWDWQWTSMAGLLLAAFLGCALQAFALARAVLGRARASWLARRRGATVFEALWSAPGATPSVFEALARRFPGAVLVTHAESRQRAAAYRQVGFEQRWGRLVVGQLDPHARPPVRPLRAPTSVAVAAPTPAVARAQLPGTTPTPRKGRPSTPASTSPGPRPDHRTHPAHAAGQHHGRRPQRRQP